MNRIIKKTTLADVALLAGVSSISVSNVINKRDGAMRPHTRKRIVRAIEELGYTPNLAARQLKLGHAAAIGIIVSSLTYPFFGHFARLVEKVALSYGYQVLLANTDRDPGREQQVAEELWEYGVRGLIFGSSLLKISHLESLIDKGLHVVAFDRPHQPADRVRIDSVGVDNKQRQLYGLDDQGPGEFSGFFRAGVFFGSGNNHHLVVVLSVCQDVYGNDVAMASKTVRKSCLKEKTG